jgi:hypothetical protein
MHVPDEKKSKLDPKANKCIFTGYFLERKGYRCFKPSTYKLQVSINGDVFIKCGTRIKLITGPQEFSISGSNNIPWKGKLRSSNIVDGSFQTSSKW